ncbi:hypothetical protein BD408DRAFT_408935 [Parasitella parasitica]|nr:hypothetical protein BD408DRAFT_408935 [Parasitella parasitica]
MPLDYSKWDNLELSDDSDIEVHPNVDKRSMIKWKQEAIHRERAERKAKIEYLTQFVPQQETVLKKVQELTSMLRDSEDDLDGIKKVVEVLDKQQTEADPKMKVPSASGKEMDVTQVFAAMKTQIAAGLASNPPAEVKKTLLDRFSQTEDAVQKTVTDASRELAKLKEQASKKMTSENMFTSEKSNKTIIPKKTGKKKEIETLNPNAAMRDLSLDTSSDADNEDDGDQDIEMSPKAAEFSKIKSFETSYKYLERNGDIINEKTSDSILGQAFTAQLKGDKEYARNCVIQSLMLVWCGQLGKDGVSRFFSKMGSTKTEGYKMFFDDVERKYSHIQTRCAEIAAEEVTEENGVETIQLQPMGDGTQLTIRVPKPEHVEAYKIFTAMPSKFQDALKTGNLDEINTVLEKIAVPEAEKLVQLCSDYGFLDVESEVIDATQQQHQ